jgi:hypothetical protein
MARLASVGTVQRSKLLEQHADGPGITDKVIDDECKESVVSAERQRREPSERAASVIEGRGGVTEKLSKRLQAARCSKDLQRVRGTRLTYVPRHGMVVESRQKYGMPSLKMLPRLVETTEV